MPEIFNDMNKCGVISKTKWFNNDEYKLKTEESMNSIFGKNDSKKIVESGCEVNVSNELPSVRENKLKDEDKPKINGQIEDFRQSFTVGDCWLLASIKSLSQYEDGKKIIKNMILQDDDGNVTVKLAGGKEGLREMYISADELKNTHGLSMLDDDVKAIEMAVRRYRKLYLIEKLKDEDVDLDSFSRTIPVGDGGNPVEALALITGKSPYEITPFYENKRNLEKGKMYDLDKIKETFATAKDRPTVLSLAYDRVYDFVTKVSVGTKDLNVNHAYSVVGVRDNMLQLRDPHRTATLIEVSLEDFAKLVSMDDNLTAYMEYVDL